MANEARKFAEHVREDEAANPVEVRPSNEPDAHLCGYMSDMLRGLSEMADRAHLTELAVLLKVGAREADREKVRLDGTASALGTLLRD